MKITSTILIIINAISRAVNKDRFTGNYTATIAKIFSLFFIFQVVSTSVIAQQFPVQVTPQLLPPYTVKISDYYNSAGAPKLNLLLLLRDFNRGSIQVRLRMSIESQQVRITTRPEAQFNAVTIFSGVPYAMAPNELEQYFNTNNLIITGISPTQYLDKLPEGFYTFCFEAVDAVTGLTLSNKGCGFSWLNLNEPPMLNIPRKAESVTPAANILFNWTPRHLSNPTANDIGYTLTLVQIPTLSTNPEADFISGVNVATIEVNTGATTTTFASAGTMTEGLRYAWRVRARPNTGISDASGFKNDGNSEIFWFTYKNDCDVPVSIADTPNVTSAKIAWGAIDKYLDYKVIYREKGNNKAEWFPMITNSPAVVVTDLKAFTEYEYRVGAACEAGNYSFAATRSFKTLPDNVVANNPDCGITPAPPTLGTTTLATLNVGDKIKAYDFEVEVTGTPSMPTGANGVFSGQGFVRVPLLPFVRLAVVFTGIRLNADKRLVDGVIETKYDPTGANIFSSSDFREIVDVFTAGYGVGKPTSEEIIIDKTVDFVITSPTNISATPPAGYNEATGTVAGGAPITVTITRTNAAPYTFTTDHLPVTIADSDGNIYQLGKDGHTVTSLGNNKGMVLIKSMNPKLIDNDKALVNFVHADGETFALDVWNSTYEKSTAFNKEYEIIEQVADGVYHVNAKAITPQAIDKLKAVVTLPTGSTVIPDDIKFVNSKGIIYTNTTYDAASKSFTIQIVGGPAKDGQYIYAIYKPATGKTLNLGKILVASYPVQKRKLKLVSVKGAPINKIEIEASLKNTYGKLGIEWDITEDEFDNDSWDTSPKDGKLQVDGSDFWSELTTEMKALNNAYKIFRKIDENTIYLFLLNQGAVSINGVTVLGDMPRESQFGYLFTSNTTPGSIGSTAVHEIGHGVFSLKHSFEYDDIAQGLLLPKNSMDYPSGEFFAKKQWDIMADPPLVLGILEKDAAGFNLATTSIPDDFADNNLTINFLTPTGKKITLPKASIINFNYGISNDEELKRPISYLYGFTLVTAFSELNPVQTRSFTAKVNAAGIFLGYFDDNDLPYQDALTASNTYNNAILFVPEKDGIYYIKYNVNLSPYVNNEAVLNYDEFPVIPYLNGDVIKKSSVVDYQNIGKVIRNQNEDWTLNIEYLKYAFTNHNTLPEHSYIAKIVELRTAYKGLFADFTDPACFDSWTSDLTYYVPYGGTAAGTGTFQPCGGVWENLLRTTPAIHQLLNSGTANRLLFYKRFVTEFLIFIENQKTSKTNFLSTLSLNTSQQSATDFLIKCSNKEIKDLEWEKRLILLQVLARSALLGGNVEKNVVRLVQYLPILQRDNLLEALIIRKDADNQDILLKRFIGATFSDLNGEEFYGFINAVNQYASEKYHYSNSNESITFNKKENRFYSFDPDFFSNKPISIEVKANGKIQFAYRRLFRFRTSTYDAVEVDPYQSVSLHFEKGKGTGEFVFSDNQTYTTSGIMAFAICNSLQSANNKIGAYVALNTVLLTTGLGALNAALAAGRVGGVILAGTDLAFGVTSILVETTLKEKIKKLSGGEDILDFWEKANLVYAGGRIISDGLVTAAKKIKPLVSTLKNQVDDAERAVLLETETQADNIIASEGREGIQFLTRSSFSEKLDELMETNAFNTLFETLPRTNGTANQQIYFATKASFKARFLELYSSAEIGSIKTIDQVVDDFEDLIRNKISNIPQARATKFITEMMEYKDKFKAAATSLEVIANPHKYLDATGDITLADAEGFIDVANGNYRFDLKFSVSNSNGSSYEILVDTKNYSQVNSVFSNMDQTKAYLSKINDYKGTRIVQQARNNISLPAMKKAFQTSLKRNDYEIFDVIWANDGLRRTIWADLPSNITPIVKSQYKNIFKVSVEKVDFSDNIFQIIKTTF